MASIEQIALPTGVVKPSADQQGVKERVQAELSELINNGFKAKGLTNSRVEVLLHFAGPGCLRATIIGVCDEQDSKIVTSMFAARLANTNVESIDFFFYRERKIEEDGDRRYYVLTKLCRHERIDFP